MMLLISHVIIDVSHTLLLLYDLKVPSSADKQIIGEILLDGDLKCMDTLARGEIDPVISAMQVVIFSINLVSPTLPSPRPS